MNKLLPALMLFVVVLLGAVLYYTVRDTPETAAFVAPEKKGPTVGDLRTRLTGRPGDRDNASETIETLTGLQEKLESDLEKERKANVQLRENLDTLVKIQVQSEVAKESDSLRSELTNRIEAVSEHARSLFERADEAPPELPKGLGFDDLPIGGAARGTTPNYGLLTQPAPSPPHYVSIKPMGMAVVAENTSGEKGSLVTRLLNGGNPRTEAQAIRAAAAADKSDEPQPRYTINDTATLFTNTTMTALLGRVPISNKVVDPFRFKVITGADNLAASGLRLPPAIKHIVWTGYTVGNRELSCVSAYFDTVTLVFEDGTISTTTVKQETRRKSAESRYLGYVSTKRGNPCIRGVLYSNANDYLKDRIALATIAAASDAAAASESTTVLNNSGTFSTGITGDTTRFIGARALSGGLDEAVEYLRERMRDAYDVVFVGTGQHLTIHVEHQIEFDYDPKGRKLDHGITQHARLANFD